MKTPKFTLIFQVILAGLALNACQRTSYDVWEDTKSCGRHVNRGFRCLGGSYRDSRAVCCPEHFYGNDGSSCDNINASEDFIPLVDENRISQVNMSEITPPPAETPGDPGSSIPGIESFRDPSTNPRLAGIYKNISFEYNSNLVKGQDNIDTIRYAADHLRKNPNCYVFVEGHCDERGPEAYNLALGARRSNAVRNMLIQEGVNPDNIFTISYGKERPLLLDHHEEAWAQNRRAEFKVYQR